MPEEYNCRGIMQLTKPYLNGNLSQSQVEKYNMHLKHCSDCQMRVYACGILKAAGAPPSISRLNATASLN